MINKKMREEMIKERCRTFKGKDVGEYQRIRDIVQMVYTDYMLLQNDTYRLNAKYGTDLADESMLLIFELLGSEDKLSDSDIRDIAIREAFKTREWHR